MDFIVYYLNLVTIRPNYDPFWLTILKIAWFILLGRVLIITVTWLINLPKRHATNKRSEQRTKLSKTVAEISSAIEVIEISKQDLNRVYQELKRADTCFTDVAILQNLRTRGIAIPCDPKHYLTLDNDSTVTYKPALYDAVVRTYTNHDAFKDPVAGYVFDQTFVIFICDRLNIYDEKFIYDDLTGNK